MHTPPAALEGQTVAEGVRHSSMSTQDSHPADLTSGTFGLGCQPLPQTHTLFTHDAPVAQGPRPPQLVWRLRSAGNSEACANDAAMTAMDATINFIVERPSREDNCVRESYEAIADLDRLVPRKGRLTCTRYNVLLIDWISTRGTVG